MDLKLGKTPARPNAVTFKLAEFIDRSKLPKPPATFGHYAKPIAPDRWGMLGNDSYGDCVWAGAAHETMLFSALGSGTACAFDDKSVLSDYSAVTGFDPNRPETDNGTDMERAAAYRRQTGIVDTNGKRHKIGAYVALRPGSVEDLWYATYLFEVVGIGTLMPRAAMDQFEKRQAWTVPKGDPQIEGGHYIPGIGRSRGRINIVTWGRVHPMTAAFYHAFSDEAIAYVSEETLREGKSEEGFDMPKLLDYLSQLKK